VLLGQIYVTTPHHKDVKQRKKFGSLQASLGSERKQLLNVLTSLVCFQLTYVPAASKPKKAAEAKKDSKKPDAFDADTQLRELQIEYLKTLLKPGVDAKLKTDAFQAFYSPLLVKHPKNLKLLGKPQPMLQTSNTLLSLVVFPDLGIQRSANLLADSQKPGGPGLQAAADAVLSACDALIGSLDTKEMCLGLARVLPEDAPIADTERRKEWTEQKEKLIEALTTKITTSHQVLQKYDELTPTSAGAAAAPSTPKPTDQKSSIAAAAAAPALDERKRSDWVSAFRAALSELRTWADLKATAKEWKSKPLQHAVWYEMWLKNEYGLLLKSVNEWLGDAEDGSALRESADKLRAQCLTKLGASWQHWKEYDKVWATIKRPNDYRLH
jgi:hypothetical protein